MKNYTKYTLHGLTFIVDDDGGVKGRDERKKWATRVQIHEQ